MHIFGVGIVNFKLEIIESILRKKLVQLHTYSNLCTERIKNHSLTENICQTNVVEYLCCSTIPILVLDPTTYQSLWSRHVVPKVIEQRNFYGDMPYFSEDELYDFQLDVNTYYTKNMQR